MKDQHDNKTVDWVGAPKSHVAIFERMILILKFIQSTPVATTSELRELALSDMSLRSAQRYLKGLEQSGYIKRILDKGWHHGDARYFLTEKSKQLFRVTA